MKSDKKILFAFLLNLAFAIFEFVGGALTGSVAILSDAVHDMGDATSIGAAYLLERKSKQKANETYTYGYVRYSALGSLLTTVILVAGSIVVIYNAIQRIITPAPINYTGMMIFAVVGVVINVLAAILTHGGHSMNQKAVNLHMLEDVLGWIVVLLGAIVMNFTDITLIDPILSIAVALFILMQAWKNLKEVLDVLLEKAPEDMNVSELVHHVSEIDGVQEVHHIHVWSLDGLHHCATMHIVATGDLHHIKHKIKEELQEHGVIHTTLEFETPGEHCDDQECRIEAEIPAHSHHHHHH